MPKTQDKIAQRFRFLQKATENIAPDKLAEESRLLTLKWPEYRFMSPWAATMMFGRRYRDMFRHAFGRYVDRNREHAVNGIALQNMPENARELSGLWSARQRADELGIRYEDYLSFCFEFAMNRKRRRLPRPNQLYMGDNELWCHQLADDWRDRLASTLGHVDLPQYRFEAYRGLPAQDQYRQFVLDVARNQKTRWRDLMRRYSVEKRQVPIRNFLTVIDRDLFDREIASLKDDGRAMPFDRVAHREPAKHELMQSCFGSPHAYAPGSEPCVACPHAQACQNIAGKILDRVATRHGTTDPVLRKKREANRLRVQRHRARKKAMQSASTAP